MSTKFILAIRGLPLADVMLALPPKIDFYSNDLGAVSIYVHYAPNTDHINPFNSNYDHLLDFENDSYSKTLSLVDDGSCTTFPRLCKLQQIMFLNSVIKKKKLNIDTPITHSINIENTIVPNYLTGVYPISSKISENCTYVIKPRIGANGTNQMLVPGKILLVFLQNLISSSGNITDHIEKWKEFGVIFTDVDSNKGNEFIVQNFVDDIVAEYRLLFFGDEIYYVKRDRSTGDYPQSNLKDYSNINKPLIPFIESDNSLASANDFTDEMIRDVRSIVGELPIPFGSIDLYLRRSNKLGILEFQSQYAFNSINHHQVIKAQTKFITNFVSNKLLKKEK